MEHGSSETDPSEENYPPIVPALMWFHKEPVPALVRMHVHFHPILGVPFIHLQPKGSTEERLSTTTTEVAVLVDLSDLGEADLANKQN